MNCVVSSGRDVTGMMVGAQGNQPQMAKNVNYFLLYSAVSESLSHLEFRQVLSGDIM